MSLHTWIGCGVSSRLQHRGSYAFTDVRNGLLFALILTALAAGFTRGTFAASPLRTVMRRRSDPDFRDPRNGLGAVMTADGRELTHAQFERWSR
jgi:hypothetical protein